MPGQVRRNVLYCRGNNSFNTGCLSGQPGFFGSLKKHQRNYEFRQEIGEERRIIEIGLNLNLIFIRINGIHGRRAGMKNTQDIAQVLSKKQAILNGDAARVEKQRAAGKMTARERIAKLLDQGSFVEMDTLVSQKEDGAGVVTGYGTVEDRPVYLFAQDYTVHGGAMGELQAAKILKVLDLALKTGAPVVALCDSAGVRLDEGAKAMDAYARVYAKMARLSGVCPMISLILGPCVGGAALIARLSDISIGKERRGIDGVRAPGCQRRHRKRLYGKDFGRGGCAGKTGRRCACRG
jgi:hypothetical protein